MQSIPRVVAFLGRAGSGKSTAAKHLVEKHGARLVSFAGPLKRLAKRCLPFDDEQMYGTQAAKEEVDSRFGLSGIQFLQRLGDGAREEIHQGVWVDAALTEIHKLWEEDPSRGLFVIDDARYVSEAEAIATDASVFGHVIKLLCPDAESTRDMDHPSEAQVDQVPPQFISHAIHSSKSPESVDLLSKVDSVLSTLFPPETSTSEILKTHGIEQP